MKTYTTDEVINLHENWWDECVEYVFEEGYRVSKPFKEWLKEKEQSELPVKGQMIWVRDFDPHVFYGAWVEREFIELTNDNKAICYSNNKLYKVQWDEYSLTDPDK